MKISANLPGQAKSKPLTSWSAGIGRESAGSCSATFRTDRLRTLLRRLFCGRTGRSSNMMATDRSSPGSSPLRDVSLSMRSEAKAGRRKFHCQVIRPKKSLTRNRLPSVRSGNWPRNVYLPTPMPFCAFIMRKTFPLRKYPRLWEKGKPLPKSCFTGPGGSFPNTLTN